LRPALSADVEAAAVQIAITVQATGMVLADLRAINKGLLRPLLIHLQGNEQNQPSGSSAPNSESLATDAWLRVPAAAARAGFHTTALISEPYRDGQRLPVPPPVARHPDRSDHPQDGGPVMRRLLFVCDPRGHCDDSRSAKAVGQRVPERDLVRVQGQGRLYRLARIFTRGQAGGHN
jgi:hypothetical protein